MGKSQQLLLFDTLACIFPAGASAAVAAAAGARGDCSRSPASKSLSCGQRSKSVALAGMVVAALLFTIVKGMPAYRVQHGPLSMQGQQETRQIAAVA